VSRSYTRPISDLYAFNLPDRLPPLPIPLLPEDPEPVLNLKELLDKIYDHSGYSYLIDYSQDPVPALSTDESFWSNKLVEEKQIR
jgi:hypothetical protein